MAHPVQKIANEFISLAARDRKSVTNMQLQKLVFFAHGFHLAINDHELSMNEVKAWNFGPVFPRLYKALEQYGRDAITDKIPVDSMYDKNEITADEKSVIEGVWDSFKDYSGGKLSAITHTEGSPWDTTWKKAKFSVIENDLIKSYYKTLTSATA